MPALTDVLYDQLKLAIFDDVSSRFLVFAANDTLLQSDGKRYTFHNYFNRELRTITSQLLMVNLQEELNNYEHNLVYVNYYGDCSELCLKWQNRVYWTQKKYKSYKPLDDALSGGLLHPNCRHTIDLYYKDLHDDLLVDNPAKFKDIRKGADFEKQLRYNERGIRKWKERYSKSLAYGNSADQAFCKKKVDDWTKRPHNAFRVNDYYNVF